MVALLAEKTAAVWGNSKVERTAAG